ncbi:MAG: S-layer homology domain-containing protein [Oscillospiraceae bacterium]|jgi:hypothetical protein|nr:S-layer homology domain-containing protein [Oscillospiraceae bacterium]
MKQRGARAAAGHLWRTRALSLLLALVMVLGLVPGWDLSVTAEAHWADGYLDQMVEWGFMNSSQTAEPNRALTRAEFMAIVNRAYGYHEKSSIPFTDVKPEDWFYDDVSIAYTANYINGTSPTTASPNSTLTREMATAVLGRNMMLKESPGELIDFSDGRNVSNWAMGIVKAATENYLIDGYEDGTFQPKRSVTRAEMAALMTRTVGTPLQEAGEYTLDGVFGNVTITSPGVTLKDTVISGDLYVTGGVGLGDVRLENVTVLGRIIAAGTGVGEKGDVSILMRNVTADELLVDNLRGQYVSLRTDGVTQIGKVTVAGSAYLEDNTPQGSGMKLISFEGSENDQLDLAGRIEEVITKTPNATVRLAKGTIENMTVDEAAPNSRVIIDRGAEIKTLNLDVGTAVSGEGDIKTLNVNAPGSTITMLPDQINIRPGITANIHGQVMDAAAAEEASRDPMILAGYPVANDVAPTTFNALFQTNKQGTVHWAVSPLSDGSVDAEELIHPSSYGSVAVQKGSVASPAASKTVSSKVASLQPGGSYYLSAVMVDGRDDRSPVKVIAFTTPDNTKPAFITGYPYFSRLTDTAAQVTVMPNKSCKLYYIVLPKGAKAPTTDQLKANSITGHLGYGVMDIEQNKEIAVDVSNRLEELKSYDLYLWLTDADGANFSAIQKMPFTTVDKTPPEFLVEPTPNKVAATSVGLNFRLNEAGTVYWALVKEGAEYPKPQRGETEVDLTGDYAKLQVASGMNALKSGKVTAAENKDGTITISGLEQEGAYDVWYVAQDKAGNYSVKVEKITIHTLDENPPVVKQYFTKHNGQDNTMNPMPNTDIVLEFSEGVRSGMKNTDGTSFLDLYNAIEQAGDGEKPALKDKLADVLSKTILFYQVTESGAPRLLTSRKAGDTEWVIDYRNAVVTSKEGKVSVIFTSEGADEERALNMESGATYFFRLMDITDTSTNYNAITPNPLDYDTIRNIKTEHVIPSFTTVFAQVSLSTFGLGSNDLPVTGAKATPVDFRIRMIPMSTSKVEEKMNFDLIFYTDSLIAYDLYYRVVDENGNEVSDKYLKLPDKADRKKMENGWVFLGNSGIVTPAEGMSGRSMNAHFNGCNASNFPTLKSLDDSNKVYYEFAISLKQKGTSTTREEWSGTVNFKVYAAAGTGTNLESLSRQLAVEKGWTDFLASGLNGNGGASIGTTRTGSDCLELSTPFADSAIPAFASGSPEWLEEGDTFLSMGLTLNRASTIYYVIAPVGGITTTLKGVTGQNDKIWDRVPDSGTDDSTSLDQPGTEDDPAVTAPDKLDIVQPPYANADIKTGKITYSGGQGRLDELVQGLKPLTKYYAYFVLQGTNTQPSEPYIFKFETKNISKPKITLNRVGSTGTVNVSTQVNSYLDYAMFTYQDLASNDTLSKTTLGEKLDSTVTAPSEDIKKLTIIEAMIREYQGGDSDPLNGYSLFDVYASSTFKAEVAYLIRSGSNDISAAVNGERTMTASKIETVNETQNMTKLTDYYFLAVAYHQASEEGTGDAFKAIGNVRVPETVPPAPIKENCSGTIYESGGKLRGSINITFDQDLYWTAGGSGSQNAAQAVYPTATTSAANTVSILDKLGGTAPGIEISTGKYALSVPGNAQAGPTGSFTINYEGLGDGDSIVLFGSGNIANSSGYTDSEHKLQVNFFRSETVNSQTGLKITTYTIRMTWGTELLFERSTTAQETTGGNNGGTSGGGTTGGSSPTTPTTPTNNQPNTNKPSSVLPDNFNPTTRPGS